MNWYLLGAGALILAVALYQEWTHTNRRNHERKDRSSKPAQTVSRTDPARSDGALGQDSSRDVGADDEATAKLFQRMRDLRKP